VRSSGRSPWWWRQQTLLKSLVRVSIVLEYGAGVQTNAPQFSTQRNMLIVTALYRDSINYLPDFVTHRMPCLYIPSDVLKEATQCSATDQNTVKCFVFGVRTGWSVRMCVLSLFVACRQTSRALPSDSHGVVTGTSQPGTRSLHLTRHNQIRNYFVILLVVNNNFR
jgi:hypothetical protein